MNTQKRPATLTLESLSKKRQTSSAVLTSPDVKMLKLTSPELERFIISSLSAVKTPSPSQYLLPENFQKPQMAYVQGFVGALTLRHPDRNMNLSASASGIKPFAARTSHLIADRSSDSMEVAVAGCSSKTMVPSTSVSSAGNISSYMCTLTSFLENAYADTRSIQLWKNPARSRFYSMSSDDNSSISTTPPMSPIPRKERRPSLNDDSFSNLPGLSPINLEEQKLLKLERKREKNRIAASKCRQKKMDQIVRLEWKKEQLKSENMKLEIEINLAKKIVLNLVEELKNLECGCQVIIPNVNI